MTDWSPTQKRSLVGAIWRGMCTRCPNCGAGSMFSGFLSVADACGHCGQELHHHRADDAPPYIVMFIVGHVVVAGLLFAEVAYEPALWIHGAIWLPATVILSLLLLRPTKGALVGIQWANRMHGFNPAQPDP